MKTQWPLVSIIVPAHNGAAFIHETLQSLLAQSYRNLEVILIDDASKDDTVVIAQSFRDKRLRIYQNHKNLGIARTRNRGLRTAQGKYITFFDHDDVMLPGAIKKRAGYLQAHKDKNMVCGYTKIMYRPTDKNGRGKELHRRIETRILGRLRAQKSALKFLRVNGRLEKKLFFRFYFIFTLLTNLMFKRHVLNRVGKFNPRLPYLNDVDYTCRAIQKNSVEFVDWPIKKYRIHGNNKSLLLSEEKINKEWLTIQKKYFWASTPSFQCHKTFSMKGA